MAAAGDSRRSSRVSLASRVGSTEVHCGWDLMGLLPASPASPACVRACTLPCRQVQQQLSPSRGKVRVCSRKGRNGGIFTFKKRENAHKRRRGGKEAEAPQSWQPGTSGGRQFGNTQGLTMPEPTSRCNHESGTKLAPSSQSISPHARKITFYFYPPPNADAKRLHSLAACVRLDSCHRTLVVHLPAEMILPQKSDIYQTLNTQTRSMAVSVVGQKNNLGRFALNYLLNQVLNLRLDALAGSTLERLIIGLKFMAQLEISLLSNMI